MRVCFKNGQKTYECTEPVEQKLYKAGSQGVAAGWVIGFSFYGDVDSEEADNLLTPEGITELTFTGEDGTSAFTVNGYSKLTSCIIRHKEAVTVTEVQLTKIDVTETATEKGV